VAQEQAAIAKEQAAIAHAVNQFLTEDVLRQADTRAQGYAGFAPNPNLTVREALERAADRIEERFKEQPHEEAAVRSSIGVALSELGGGGAGDTPPEAGGGLAQGHAGAGRSGHDHEHG
jgi:hypothetical protein